MPILITSSCATAAFPEIASTVNSTQLATRLNVPARMSASLAGTSGVIFSTSFTAEWQRNGSYSDRRIFTARSSVILEGQACFPVCSVRESGRMPRESPDLRDDLPKQASCQAVLGQLHDEPTDRPFVSAMRWPVVTTSCLS